jgi:hypothetical protein
MIEFDTLCYLQNQKTGCTFVESFLREHCREDIWRYEKHRAPRVRKPNKFYFVNVREPLETYLSLFNYGLDGKGELLGRLSAAGKRDLYARGLDGFCDWLEAVLDERNAPLIYPAGAVSLASCLGLVSFRYLRLAAFGLENAACELESRNAVSTFALQHQMVNATVRYESLRDDLATLFSGPLRHTLRDPDLAMAWLNDAPKVNTSQRRDHRTAPVLPKALTTRLREREWYLFLNFYS